MAEAATLLTGWGRTAPSLARQRTVTADLVGEVVLAAGPRGVVARGLGRSYGDPAQNAGGDVLVLRGDDVAGPEAVVLDPEAGTVRVHAGVSFHYLMGKLLPAGYFVPVTPGTRFVTVGGAIAADVHGKNHHRRGSLGGHLEELDLVTADGNRRTVGPSRGPALFWATVGGMGLTGIITSATIRLQPVETAYVEVATERLPDLDSVMARIIDSDAVSTYSVAWIDTLARGRNLGRSVLTRGEHARLDRLTGAARRHPRRPPGEPRLAAPPRVPSHLVSRASVRAFNELWFRKAPRLREGEIQPIATFFHPLDGIAGWNRMYGARGFVQYQCVLPDPEEGRLTRLLERIAATGHPSFLAVLKRFGPGNAGPLSFPTAGWTLALDLPADPALAALFDDLDRMVLEAGGRLYLAKDSRLSARTAAAMYPRWEEFRDVRREVDPRGVFQSDLSRRLGL
jgi:decaprenylphospho-beta-D-ribofuranose 2-oxidase